MTSSRVARPVEVALEAVEQEGRLVADFRAPPDEVADFDLRRDVALAPVHHLVADREDVGAAGDDLVERAFLFIGLAEHLLFHALLEAVGFLQDFLLLAAAGDEGDAGRVDHGLGGEEVAAGEQRAGRTFRLHRALAAADVEVAVGVDLAGDELLDLEDVEVGAAELAELLAEALVDEAGLLGDVGGGGEVVRGGRPDLVGPAAIVVDGRAGEERVGARGDDAREVEAAAVYRALGPASGRNAALHLNSFSRSPGVRLRRRSWWGAHKCDAPFGANPRTNAYARESRGL